jgi:hypothetical protein
MYQQSLSQYEGISASRQMHVDKRIDTLKLQEQGTLHEAKNVGKESECCANLLINYLSGQSSSKSVNMLE